MLTALFASVFFQTIYFFRHGIYLAVVVCPMFLDRVETMKNNKHSEIIYIGLSHMTTWSKNN